jgi:hypothetical protein
MEPLLLRGNEDQENQRKRRNAFIKRFLLGGWIQRTKTLYTLLDDAEEIASYSS